MGFINLVVSHNSPYSTIVCTKSPPDWKGWWRCAPENLDAF